MCYYYYYAIFVVWQQPSVVCIMTMDKTTTTRLLLKQLGRETRNMNVDLYKMVERMNEKVRFLERKMAFFIIVVVFQKPNECYHSPVLSAAALLCCNLQYSIQHRFIYCQDRQWFFWILRRMHMMCWLVYPGRKGLDRFRCPTNRTELYQKWNRIKRYRQNGKNVVL